MQAGVAIEVIWESTPWELSLILRAFADRERAKHSLALATAWHVAALVPSAMFAPKQFPRLADVLGPMAPRKVQTWQHQKAIMQALSAEVNARQGA